MYRDAFGKEDPTVCRAFLWKFSVEMDGKSLGWLENQPEAGLSLNLLQTVLPVWAWPWRFPSLSLHVLISMKKWRLTPRAARRSRERIPSAHRPRAWHICPPLHWKYVEWSWRTWQCQMAVFFVCRCKEAGRDFFLNVWFAHIHKGCLKTEWHIHDVIIQKCSPGVNFRL